MTTETGERPRMAMLQFAMLAATLAGVVGTAPKDEPTEEPDEPPRPMPPRDVHVRPRAPSLPPREPPAEVVAARSVQSAKERRRAEAMEKARRVGR